jgi:hypothetical protein
MADRGYSALNITKRALEQPSILEALKSAYVDISASDPGIGPQIMVSPKNLGAFQSALTNPIYKKIKSQSINEAIAFLQTRYPKLFGLANRGIHERVIPGNFGKQFDVADDTGKYIGSSIILNPKANATTKDAVETLSHELIHSLQSKRLGLERIKQIYGSSRPEYNPLEILGERGAKTAKESYLKLLSLMGQ